MSVNYLGYLAAALYIAAATSILLKQLNKTQNVLTSFLSKIFIYLAVICHGTSLYFSANSKVGANFSLFNTASIIALIITIIIVAQVIVKGYRYYLFCFLNVRLLDYHPVTLAL